MVFFIVAAGVILIITAVVLYFFCIAFVRRDISNIDDLNSPVNRVLDGYKEMVSQGMEYIESTPHKWVETISLDGLKLCARYYDIHSPKTVIIFHGYRSSASRDFSCAVQMYNSFGFNVLLVDQRSHGRSEGRLITFGVKESDDVSVWIKFVTEKYAPEKIVLGGMSMGATTVLLSAGKGLPEKVKAIIADCGFTSPEDIIKLVAKKDFHINATPFMPLMNFCCKIFGNFTLKGISTINALKKCNIPVLLIHGENDGFVPCEMSKQAIKSCNKNSRLTIIPNADHGFSFLVDKQKILAEIKDFLKSVNC